MSKIYKRYLLPALLTTLIIFLYLFNTAHNDFYHRSQQFIDSLGHKPSHPPQDPKLPPKPETEEIPDPCTIESPSRGFIDLRELSAFISDEAILPQPWLARGYGAKRNYTLGICSSPITVDDVAPMVDGLNKSDVGAFYEDPVTHKYVSMGNFSTAPKFRGKKLSLLYEGGSYCGELMDKSSGERLRKSTLITFVCDREMMKKASVSFVGSFNECNYIFEVRSHHVCPTAPQGNDFAVVWIFLLIVLAALAVYFSGGFLYKKMKVQPKI